MWMDFGCETSLYLKRQKRVNTFLRSNCPRVYRMNARMASFFIFLRNSLVNAIFHDSKSGL